MYFRKRRLKMKILIVLVVMLTWVKGLPFPEDMYHTPDPAGFQDLLEGNGYEVRELNDKVTNKTALADLMLWECPEEGEMQTHELPDLGRVAVKGRTYTQAHWQGGRYYATVADYDRACQCPILYKVTWRPFWGKYKIFSPEQRGGHVEVETTQINVADEDEYIVFRESVSEIAFHESDKPTKIKEDSRIYHLQMKRLTERFWENRAARIRNAHRRRNRNRNRNERTEANDGIALTGQPINEAERERNAAERQQEKDTALWNAANAIGGPPVRGFGREVGPSRTGSGYISTVVTVLRSTGNYVYAKIKLVDIKMQLKMVDYMIQCIIRKISVGRMEGDIDR